MKRVSILSGESYSMITDLRASRTVRSHGYALEHPCDVVLYESRTHLLHD